MDPVRAISPAGVATLRFFRVVLGALALATGLGVAGPARAVDILIGTGDVSGVYYHAGRAICHMVNRYGTGPTCKARPTAGSLYNLSQIQGGGIELGLVQSDWQYHAVNRSGPFEFMGLSFGGIRSLFSLHAEPFTVVVRRDAAVRRFDDLRGKRVNIGNPGSGQRATMEVVMAAKGWTREDFALVDELPASQQSLSLCHGRVQAIIYTVGHPNASVSKATGLCDSVVVPVDGPEIDRMIRDVAYYSPTIVPGGTYPGNPDPVPTFGVKATVVVSADMDEETAYQVVKTVFDNLDRFRRAHPAFGILSAREMVTDGLTAPLHDGAARYFRERGLLPQ